MPGVYPAYPQPGYGHPAGYPQSMPPVHVTPLNYAVSDTFGSGDWDDRKLVGDFVRANMAVYYASYAVFPVTYLTLACCQAPRRRFPWNIILLTLLLFVYNTKAVIIAVIVAVVSISGTIFCFQTKVDFTSCTGLFCILGIVMMVTGLITAIMLAFKHIYWQHMVYAALGAICFTLGTPSALQIYTDIVYIFTFVLQLVGSRD
ncbi:hypothetical protein FD755_011012 [Muntiacus reevesi]|uniref:Transmembrane BAX inhibitor motif-containing protein 1 n=1 Tax=Muntiacus reevesi TaxID=9886 RepID=A0A5N3XRB6_MUNRE|nr:hypothetical protein FD755_011012 [Muntiacus reevesi]